MPRPVVTDATAARKPGRPRDPDLEARRKREILAAAATVFARTGFADTDVQAIADAVGVGKGTVYRYFPTKTALFLAAVDQGLQELAERIDAVILDDARDPLDRFAGAVRAYLAFFADRPDMVELFVQERATFRDRHPPLYFARQSDGTCDRTDEFLVGLIRRGVLRPLQLEHVREVLSDLLYGTVMANAFSGRRVSAARHADEILDLVFHGILSESERHRMTAPPPPTPPKPKRTRAAKAPAFLLAFGALALPACTPTPTAATTAAESPAVTITTATVQTRSVQRFVAAVGSLTGYDEVILSPKVDGRVLKVHRDVGDRVFPGDVVLELDPVDLQLEVDSARRALESELARLGLASLPTPDAAGSGFRPEDVPAVARSILVLENARVEQQRIAGLVASASISKRESDTANLDLKTAEVGKRDAITQALSTLATARLKQAQLESAEQHLKDAVVCAPVPDVFGAWAAAVGPAFTPLSYAVSARMVSEGEMLRSNPVSNVFRLVIDQGLKLRANVPEQYAAEVRGGQSVQLRVDAYPDRAFTGLVTRINPTIDSQTRTFLVEVSVPNLDRRLKAGGFARAQIDTRTEVARTIPPSALLTFAGVTKVFTVVDGKAKAVEVRLGNRDREWLEVTSDLPAGTTLATSGFSQLIEDSAVLVRK